MHFPNTRSQATEDEIAVCAYYIWEQEGKPNPSTDLRLPFDLIFSPPILAFPYERICHASAALKPAFRKCESVANASAILRSLIRQKLRQSTNEYP